MHHRKLYDKLFAMAQYDNFKKKRANTHGGLQTCTTPSEKNIYGVRYVLLFLFELLELEVMMQMDIFPGKMLYVSYS